MCSLHKNLILHFLLVVAKLELLRIISSQGKHFLSYSLITIIMSCSDLSRQGGFQTTTGRDSLSLHGLLLIAIPSSLTKQKLLVEFCLFLLNLLSQIVCRLHHFLLSHFLGHLIEVFEYGPLSLLWNP